MTTRPEMQMWELRNSGTMTEMTHYPPQCLIRGLINLFLVVASLFTLCACEKGVEDDAASPTFTREQLIGDWNIISATVPIGNMSADVAWK